MKELVNRFIRSLVMFTAALAVSGFVFSYFTTDLITKFWPLLLLLFAGITLTLVTLLFSASEKKFSRFSNTFMISSMLKILLLLILIGAYSFKFQEDAIRFSVTLLVFYLFYLGFEIFWLLKLQRSVGNK
jgi:H+/Cl- antiporter ClcA